MSREEPQLRDIAVAKLHVAQGEAMRLQDILDSTNAAIMKADSEGDQRAMARLYRQEAELLQKRADAAHRVAAIASVLYDPDA